MASYHLRVKSVSRSDGRSATAAAAYRSGSRIDCEREGKTHDYARKGGVVSARILAPEDAPEWAEDRARLWNAAEAAEGRKNSVVAREWELALPADLDAEGRRALAEGFAAALVERYGVAADVAIHAPHAEGDDRNHHAHILTTTRRMGAEGLAEKTRILDVAATSGPEVERMRAVWAEMQNRALERAGASERVDHRSLEAQREEQAQAAEQARASGRAAEAERAAHEAETLDRPAEPRLGVASNAMERRAQREAEAQGAPYTPVTARGAEVVELRRYREERAALKREAEEKRRAVEEAERQEREGAALEAEARRLAAELDKVREARAQLEALLAQPEALRASGKVEKAQKGVEIARRIEVRLMASSPDRAATEAALEERARERSRAEAEARETARKEAEQRTEAERREALRTQILEDALKQRIADRLAETERLRQEYQQIEERRTVVWNRVNRVQEAWQAVGFFGRLMGKAQRLAEQHDALSHQVSALANQSKAAEVAFEVAQAAQRSGLEQRALEQGWARTDSRLRGQVSEKALDELAQGWASSSVGVDVARLDASLKQIDEERKMRERLELQKRQEREPQERERLHKEQAPDRTRGMER